MDATRRPPPTIDQLGLVGDDACAGGGRMVVRAADVPPHLGGCVVALPHVPPCSRARASQLESASLPVPAGQGRAGAGQGRCWDCLPQVRGGRRSGTGSRGRVLRCSQCTCGPSSAPARPEVMGGPSERTAGGGGLSGTVGAPGSDVGRVAAAHRFLTWPHVPVDLRSCACMERARQTQRDASDRTIVSERATARRRGERDARCFNLRAVRALTRKQDRDHGPRERAAPHV
jgi:hypothetical protein